MKSLGVVIACGGTGGHLFPGIAVAEELKARGHNPLLLISEKAVDQEASKKYGDLEFVAIPAIAKPPTLSLRMVPFLWKLFLTIRRCKKLLRERKMDAVVGMGGFTSMPPVFAANRMGLAAFVHDSNALPGRANVMTARYCHAVFVGMKETAEYFPRQTVEVTGTPVRKEIRVLPSRADAAAKLGLDAERPVVAVMGGSQGARQLNRLVAEAFTDFPPGTQVLHVAGTKDLAEVQASVVGKRGYVVLGFCDDMASVYAVADLCVCRSGASSLTELAHAGVPSILVPYPFAADDHQTKNAAVFVAAGASKMAQERELDAEKLAGMVGEILQDAAVYAGMKKATSALNVADAAGRVCDAIEKTIEVAVMR